MQLRTYWQFYKSIFPFVAAFALLGMIGLGVFWGFILFISIGLLFGFLGFHSFRKNEWYFYYNLGITKWKLLQISFLINLLIGLPVFTILFLIISLFIGDFTII